MNHLFADMLRGHDPLAHAYVTIEALIGGGIAMAMLLKHRSSRLRPAWLALLFGCVLTGTSWSTFFTTVTQMFPQLNLTVPLRSAIPALAISLCGASGAGLIQLRGRRSARNAMLAGSLFACGFSCMLFTGMAALVRPFALAYDLTAVLFIMVLASAVAGFAFWELSNPGRRRPWLIGTVFTTVAIDMLTFGSIGAILPFDAWMNAVANPDDLASAPVGIIVAAEAIAVLVFSLSGSLVDNRVAARDQLETDRFRQLADSTLEGILIHRDGQILDGNVSLATLLGIELTELRNTPLARFVAPGTDTSVWTPEEATLPAQTEILAANGTPLPVEILSRVISYGGLPAMATSLRDVRERRASEERIHFLAHHDVLTELPNRVLLSETLDTALRGAKRAVTSLAVLCLDLDGFKLVNDTLGHAAGDSLLRQVANRLRDNLRESDFVARVGGDEFVVLQTAGVQPEQAAALAQRIIECLAPSFQIDAHKVNVGTSIGIAFYPQDGSTPAALLKNADIALYRAKQTSRGGFQMFESGMDLAMRERRALEQDLRTGLQNNEFALQYQPVFDRNLNLVGFEALVRWQRAAGLVPPSQFISLAEECGVIIPLGEWIMRTACAAATTWHPGCRVAVNLSPAQFARGDVCGMVATVLAETGLPPHRLELEITEGLLIDNTDSAIHTLRELRALGTRLVLDDFGTGYSSLSYLQRFPFDKLKVDQSFVQRLETDPGSRAIVKAIIAMSHSLNLEVTAEGVETTEQLQLLCAAGCHELQGFLLGRPISSSEVDGFLHANLSGDRLRERLDVVAPLPDEPEPAADHASLERQGNRRAQAATKLPAAKQRFADPATVTP